MMAKAPLSLAKASVDESESFFEKKKASVDEKFFCGLLKSVKSDRVDYSNYF